jgi:hypothetical protein
MKFNGLESGAFVYLGLSKPVPVTTDTGTALWASLLNNAKDKPKFKLTVKYMTSRVLFCFQI